jgi:hypothetical protein
MPGSVRAETDRTIAAPRPRLRPRKEWDGHRQEDQDAQNRQVFFFFDTPDLTLAF